MASKSIVIKDFKTEIPGTLSENRKEYVFPDVASVNAHGKKSKWIMKVRAIDKATYDRLIAGTVPARLLDNPNSNFYMEINDEWFNNNPLQDVVAVLRVDSGIEGGKVREVKPTYITSGLNQGKKNATNVWCQALRDALSLYNKQKQKASLAPADGEEADDDGEQRNPGSDIVRYPPMLAQVGDLDKVDFGKTTYADPKYNGLRGMGVLSPVAGSGLSLDKFYEGNFNPRDTEVIMYSRKRHLFPGLADIRTELHAALVAMAREGVFAYVDGEIYAHGRQLQDISGFARKSDVTPEDFNGLSAVITYVIYDIFVPAHPKLTQSERNVLLDTFFEKLSESQMMRRCQKVPRVHVTSKQQVLDLYHRYLKDGYEGAMIRLDSPYAPSFNDYHSSVLLKIKPCFDAEFEVVGFGRGKKGKAANALMLECVTAEHKHFNVTPAMEIDERERLLRVLSEPVSPEEIATLPDYQRPNIRTKFDLHVRGRMMVVTFDEYSKDRVPQRARTRMLFRDNQDRYYTLNL